MSGPTPDFVHRPVLVDVYDVQWPIAWQITCETCSYTNHTLLPEALETWPISFFERLLPRHLQHFLNRLIERLRQLGLPLTDLRLAGLLHRV